MELTAPLTVSTIGEVIRGGAMDDPITQSTLGENGIEFRVGSGTITPGGGGIYFNGVENRQIAQANDNSGTGLSAGDPSSTTSRGDYFIARCVYLTRWQTAIHFANVAMGWLQNISINNPVDAPGDFGVRLTGINANSHLWQGVTVSNVQIAFSLETTGMGNVIMPGDFGGYTYGADIYAGMHVAFFGGNAEWHEEHDELPETGPVFNIRENARVLIANVGGHGARTSPPIVLNGSHAYATHINTYIATAAGVMLVTGAGYGQDLGFEPGISVDTEESPTGQRWKSSFPAYLSTAIPTPSAANRLAIILCVKNDPDHRDGTLQCVYDTGTSSWRWEWLNSGNYL